MKLLKHSFMSLTVLTAVTVSTLAVAAPNQQNRPQWSEQQQSQFAQQRFDRRFGELKLSPAQITQIKAIEAQYRSKRPRTQNNNATEQQAWQAQRQQMRQQRLNLLRNKTFDSAKAQQLIDQENHFRAQMRASHEQMRGQNELDYWRKEHAIFQVLNQQQQQQYLQRAQQVRPMAARGGHKMGQRGQRQGIKATTSASQ